MFGLPRLLYTLSTIAISLLVIQEDSITPVLLDLTIRDVAQLTRTKYCTLGDRLKTTLSDLTAREIVESSLRTYYTLEEVVRTSTILDTTLKDVVDEVVIRYRAVVTAIRAHPLLPRITFEVLPEKGTEGGFLLPYEYGNWGHQF